ncbi:MAG: preprotein translocase subunit YajC [Proteobacteria bacterium]|nr:preprotein translocase subunit YajC [Pseudomonadota bacterium]
MEFFPVILQANGGGGLGGILLLWVPIIFIFWFFMIRPQMKRAKEHRAMIGAVGRGDTVTTAGGLIGKVVRVQDHEVEVEISPGVKVRVVKQTLSEVEGKNQPAPERIKGPELSADEKKAFKTLGLEPGARRAEIKGAHKKLIVKVHPDKEGNPYLAGKLNSARDLLLGKG